MTTTVHGYPRIGPDRELKRACEAYWSGRCGPADLDAVGARLRRDAWEAYAEAGIDEMPSNTFSYYDHMLDTAVLFGAVPTRFGRPEEAEDRATELDRYFAMARGVQDTAPLEMTKWFDTNYHYLVPELSPHTGLRLVGNKPLAEFTQAKGLGYLTRPVIVGPVTFLLLSKPAAGAPEGWSPLELLDTLLPAYAELLRRLRAAGAEDVQLDEPVLAADRGRDAVAEFERAYRYLAGERDRPRITVGTYFGPIGTEALEAFKRTGAERIALDLVAGPDTAEELAAVSGLGDAALVAGVVDGRNVWRTDVRAALSRLSTLMGLAREVVVGTSCSLLHVPVDLDAETGMDPALRARLAFARQKLDEVALLGRALSDPGGAADELERARADLPEPEGFRNAQVRARLDSLGKDGGERLREGRWNSEGEPQYLPTTTIGSFPQTEEIRKARAEHRTGAIGDEEYESRMKAEIDKVIALQEDIGLDVLVHGEPERNDMVQYFAERLGGYTTTAKGWVQSYGSRCVRPPILFGDVHRPEPMTVPWATYAQSRTSKPVKGMLTGPVTMLAWSFVRDDQPLADTARQVALALRDEVADLERAGIRHIQVDEAALRELLPLRASERQAYLDWAVGSFRLATSGVGGRTLIHTHMCYSEFGEIVGAIEALGADVTSVEAARSHMELVDDLDRSGYRRGIGPGVYDIHSPRVPSADEIEAALRTALRAVEPERLWVNPDCGLKTRGYPEVEPALRNMVEAARRVRADLTG